MPRPPTTKPPAILAELAAFADTVQAVPYGELPAAYRAAGFVWRLREVEVLPAPDASAIVRCDFMVGRAWEALSVLDTVTIRLPQGVGPLSVAARVQLEPTLIYLVSGRLPPAPERQAGPVAPERTVDMSRVNGRADDDVVLDDERPLPGEMPPGGGEYVGPEPLPLKVVARLEPDGVPVFADLYALGGPRVTTRDVVNAVLNEVEDFLEKATSVEEVTALGAKNAEMIAFVKDLGEDEDIVDLQKMVLDRREALRIAAATGGASVPRRRRSAAATH